MKRIFTALLSRISTDPNERKFWLGLLLLFIGLTWSRSVFLAFTVVGAVLAIESVVTSYLAALITSREKQ